MLPFDPDEVRIEPSKHSRNLRMRKWDWDVHDLRDALRSPVRVERQAPAYVFATSAKSMALGSRRAPCRSDNKVRGRAAVKAGSGFDFC